MNNNYDFSKKIFETHKINRIIWIDDWFSDNRTLQDIIKEIIKELSVLDEMEELLNVQHDLINNIDFKADKEIWLDQLQDQVFSNETKDNLKNLLESLARPNDDDTIINRICPILKDSIDEIIVLSLNEWEKQKDNILTRPGQTLFLIDLNFSKEGLGPEHGKEIIKEVLPAIDHTSACILFTYACSPGSQEETLRTKVFHEITVDVPDIIKKPYMLSVLSKKEFNSEITEQPLIDNLTRILLTKFIRKMCLRISIELKNNIINSIDNVCDNFSSANIYQIDNTIFNSVLEDGTSEIDLIFRLFQISQKTAISNLSSNNAVIQELMKLRELKDLSQNFEIIEHTPNCFFKNLREKEIWESSNINSHCSPLMNGDVFKYNDKKYILLAQPCDLMIRGKSGNRKPYEGTLFLLERKVGAPASTLKSSRKNDELYCIQEISSKRNFTNINFKNSIHVNLNILEWCVFNKNGQVSLETSPNLDPIVFLPGWIKKFNDTKSMMEKNDDPKTLPTKIQRMSNSYAPLGDNDVNFEPELNSTGDKWVTGLVRIARLKNPYAEHALLKYFSFKSRKAFESDFV